MTIIRPLDSGASSIDDRVVKRYQSSSVIPADQDGHQVMCAHGQSMRTALNPEGIVNNVTEEDLAAMLPKIAESISRLDSTEAQDILPGITQNITKLQNGGNLVITTMTRNVDQEEEVVPGSPVRDVQDNDNSKIYYVQDSNGDMFYVEDITGTSQNSSDVTSRHSSSSYHGHINSSNIAPFRGGGGGGGGGGSVGKATAKEIIAAMYGGGNDVQEINENEEEWSERTYEYEIPCRRNKNAVDLVNSGVGGQNVSADGGQSVALERYQGSSAVNNGLCLYDASMMSQLQNYNQAMRYGGMDDANSVSTVTIHNAEEGGKTIERLIVEGEVIEYPEVPMMPQIWLPPPPMCVQTDNNYSLVKVDMTPTTRDQGTLVRHTSPKIPETPIYQTVASVRRQPPPPPRKTEVQESCMIIGEREGEEETRRDYYEEVSSKMAMGQQVVQGSYSAEGKKSLSEFLMQRLSMVDNLDIRQNIDVKHETHDIHGDPNRWMRSGDKEYHVTATNIYDRVAEAVDLCIKEGRAMIVVTVTAERVKPADLEFSIWKSHQAIVTRTIEVDLFATERRRELYHQVMAEQTVAAAGAPRELDSQQTLDFFTRVLGEDNPLPVQEPLMASNTYSSVSGPEAYFSSVPFVG